MIELDLIRFVSSAFQRAAQEVTVAISVVFCMIYWFILWPCCVCACMRVRVLMFASCIFPPWLASPVCLIFSQMPRGFCQFVFVALASKLAHIIFWLPALLCDSWSKELVLRICTTATVASCFLSVTHIRTPARLNNKGLQTFFLKQLFWTGLVIIHENVLIKQQMWSFLVRSVGSLQRLYNGMQPPGNINYHFFYSDLQAKDGKFFKAMAWLAALKGEKKENQMHGLNCKRVVRVGKKQKPKWYAIDRIRATVITELYSVNGEQCCRTPEEGTVTNPIHPSEVYFMHLCVC